MSAIMSEAQWVFTSCIWPTCSPAFPAVSNSTSIALSEVDGKGAVVDGKGSVVDSKGSAVDVKDS
eukprot:2892972-Pyramimonas_sp.AAC.1